MDDDPWLRGTLDHRPFWRYYYIGGFASFLWCSLYIISILCSPKTILARDVALLGLLVGCAGMSAICATQCAANDWMGSQRYQDLGGIWCTIEGTGHIYFILLQILSILLLAIAAYTPVSRLNKKMSRNPDLVPCTGWIWLLVISLFSLLGVVVTLPYSKPVLQPAGTYCFPPFRSPMLLLLVVCLVISLSAIAVLYCRIYCIADKLARQDAYQNKRLETAPVRKLAKRTIVYYLLFLVGWGPAAVACVWAWIDGDIPQELEVTVGVHGITFSLLVAAVYGGCHREVKRCLRRCGHRTCCDACCNRWFPEFEGRAHIRGGRRVEKTMITVRPKSFPKDPPQLKKLSPEAKMSPSPLELAAYHSPAASRRNTEEPPALAVAAQTLSPTDNKKEGSSGSTATDKDQDSKRAVLEIILAACQQKTSANGNSNSKTTRYRLTDAVQKCLGTRDSYVLQTTIGDLRGSQDKEWWETHVARDGPAGYYGTEIAVQALIDFIQQGRTIKELLPPPQQLVQSLLYNHCRYKDPEAKGAPEYYKLADFVKCLGDDPQAFEVREGKWIQETCGLRHEDGFWISEAEAMKILPKITLGKTPHARKVKESMMLYKSEHHQKATEKDEDSEEEEEEGGEKKGPCQCLKGCKGPCRCRHRKCTPECACKGTCKPVPIPDEPVQDFCDCNLGMNHGVNTCTKCRCQKEGRKCTVKCRCKGKCGGNPLGTQKKSSGISMLATAVSVAEDQEDPCECALNPMGMCSNCRCRRSGRPCTDKCKCSKFDRCTNTPKKQQQQEVSPPQPEPKKQEAPPSPEPKNNKRKAEDLDSEDEGEKKESAPKKAKVEPRADKPKKPPIPKEVMDIANWTQDIFKNMAAPGPEAVAARDAVLVKCMQRVANEMDTDP